MPTFYTPPNISNGIRIVCLGDSITSNAHPDQYVIQLAKQLLGLGVVADCREFGYPFQEVSVIRTHVTDALAAIASNPGGNNVLIVEAGTNDILHSIAPATSAANYDGLLSDIRADSRGATIPVFCINILSANSELWTTGPPVAFTVNEPAISNFDAMIATKAALYGCHVVDVRAALLAGEQLYNAPAPGVANGIFTLAGDGVHPSERGANLIASTTISKFLAVASLVGGGYPDTNIKWLVTERTAATALATAANKTVGNYDFTTDIVDSHWLSTVTAGGSVTVSTTLPGVLLVNTANTNANAWAHPAGKPVQIANILTNTAFCSWYVKFTANDAGSRQIVGLYNVGLADTAGGIGLGIVGATSTTLWCTVTSDGSAGDVATATSTNLDTGSFHIVRLFLNSGTADWYVDGTKVATQALTSGLVGATTPAMVVARSRNPADAVSRTLQLDRMIFRS